MNRYETYKPSGIDWIGEVPTDWKTLRIKNVASIVNGSTPSSSVEEYWDGNIIWATPGDFNKFDRIIDDSESKITEAGYKSCGTSMVPVGSVVITTRAPIGNVLIAGKELCTNQGCKTLVPNRVESRFLYYIISISSIELNILGQGTTFLELSKESLGTFKLPLPEFEEQLTIANYLDDQTQKIDHLIANKKAQAEKLKELRQIEINNAVTKGLNPNAEMKDSGIEWLGDIPKHWTTKRMKDVASVRGRIGFRGYTVDDIVDEGALVIGAKHINSSNQLNFDDPEYISWEKYYESPEIMVEVGDVLIVQRGSIGKFALVEKEIGPATINPSMILLRLNTRIHPQFLFWYLLGEHMFNIIKTIVSSTAVPMISQMQAGVFRIILPPKKEQIEIANYLTERTTAIDQLIKNIEAQIEKLQELRKIKIYEAVTGKIKVNAYAETTA